MNRKPVISFLFAVVILFGGRATLHASEGQKEEAAVSSKLITAIEKSDYEAFVADGDGPFRQLKKEQFEAVAAQLASRFKGGYEVTPLGDLRQKGYHVTLWRVRFKDGGDDALATLSMKAGKVSGFWIR